MTHTMHDEEVDEFNAGYDAYKAGLPLESEPETKHDLWRAGYAFSAFYDLRAEVERLRAAAGERDALRAEGSWVIVPNPGRDECALHDCPPGLFLFEDTVGFKTEYGDDAYIVESGEMFWGGTNNEAERRRLRVHPALVALTAVPAAPPQADDRLAVAEAGAREMQEYMISRASGRWRLKLMVGDSNSTIDVDARPIMEMIAQADLAAVARRAVAEQEKP